MAVKERYDTFGETASKDETVTQRATNAIVTSDECSLLTMSREEMHNLHDLEWFKPLLKRLHKQSGKSMVQLLTVYRAVFALFTLSLM